MSAQIVSIPETEFAQQIAVRIATEIRAAIEARGACRLALAGGETPRAIHTALAACGKEIAWEKVWITFGDERCVAPEDPASNYRMARETLLEKVPILPEHVFRMRGEVSQERGAAEYEELLQGEAVRTGEERYVHDLILLGMGEDGHTASLFPGLPAVEERERSVVATFGPKPPPQRISMTLPLLNAARQVFFILRGVDKASILRQVLAGDEQFPSARVQPASGTVTWMLTEELANAVAN